MKNIIAICIVAVFFVAAIMYGYFQKMRADRALDQAESNLVLAFEANKEAHKQAEISAKEAERANNEAIAARNAREEAQQLQLALAKCKCPK